MNDPVVTSIDLIRHAIAGHVHDLGGDALDVDQIATSAAYAVFIGAAADALRG